MKGLKADDFGAYAVKELMHRSGVKVGDLDELIFGNVIQPTSLLIWQGFWQLKLVFH